MSLNAAHTGYAYQDILSAYFILNEVLAENNSEITIDQKEVTDDRFDDIIIKNDNGTFRKQIKYSDGDSEHTFSKDDIARDGNYDLALHSLFYSWKLFPEGKNANIRLCLSWLPPDPSNDIVKILSPVYSLQSFPDFNTKIYSINVDKLWKKGGVPLQNWQKFRKESTNIDRDEFVDFCNCLLIEVAFPKASLDIYRPGDLEKILLSLMVRLGVGEYPNEHLSTEESSLAIIELARKHRSKGGVLYSRDILKYLRIRTDYGAIEQRFPVNNRNLVGTSNAVNAVLKSLVSNNKIILTGEPGAGKSWFINNLEKKLKDKSAIAKHYCYTDLKDTYQQDRIKQKTLYGNIISDILNTFPDLKGIKQKRYASTLNELNLLINSIPTDILIIIDGLDHVQRIYELNKGDLTATEVDIIDTINKIDLTNEKVKFIILSQPISELNNIGGFITMPLPKWSLQETKTLLKKNDVLDRLENLGGGLVQALYIKSNGNPLYLSYLIQEIKIINDLNIETIEKLPSYSFNLSNYYTYLLTILNENEDVPQILSGARFYLNKEELIEITGNGDYVEKALTTLLPILSYNHSQGGYSIYHESFRRFTLERLISKNISVKRRIYKPLSDWLESKGFWIFDKSVRFYLSLLIEQEEYLKVSEYVKTDFVHECLFYGHSWDVIENNYRALVRASCRLQRFEKIILLSEIGRVLSSTKDVYESCFSLYFSALGSVHSYAVAVKALEFEGKPTITNQLGLMACRICEYNNTHAPWKLYFKKRERLHSENFLYFVSYLLAEKDYKRLSNVAKRINNSPEFRWIFKQEVENWVTYSKNDEWIDDYPNIKKILTPEKHNQKGKNINVVAQRIIEFEHVHEKERSLILDFISIVEREFKKGNTSQLESVFKLFVAKNWFYNWIVFYAKISILKLSDNCTEENILATFKYLVYDVEPFKGKPRACDLYQIHSLILESINLGLALVKTEKSRVEIISMLQIVSKNTTTSLQKSLSGPLSPETFLELLTNFTSDEQLEHTIPLFEEKIEDEEKNYHRLYQYLAEYNLRLTRLYALKNERNKYNASFRSGLLYLLAYTFRKDTTLEELLNSIESISNIKAIDIDFYIKKLKILSETVINHTDGKGTQYFPVNWFEKYCKIDLRNSIIYLASQLLTVRYDWRLEKSLKYLLTHLNGSINPIYELLISCTLPSEDGEEFLNNGLDLVKQVESIDPKLAKSYLQLIGSKLYISYSQSYSKKFIDKLTHSNRESKILLEINHEKEVRSDKPAKRYKTKSEEIDSNNGIRSRSFSEMTPNEIIQYIETEFVTQKDAMGLFCSLNEIPFNDEKKEIIKLLASKDRYLSDHEHSWTDDIFEDDSESAIYYFVCKYVYQQSGWFESLVNIQAFETAYSKNPDLTLQFLAELLEQVLKNISWNRTVSANLINAFVKTRDPEAASIPLWENLYQMIDERLPAKEIFDWDAALPVDLQELTNEELLICILLTRLRSNTSERHHWVVTSIDYLLKNDSNNLVKPLKWFFRNKDKFLEITQVSIIQLLVENEKGENSILDRLSDDLKSLYPSNYFLLDLLIEQKFNLLPRAKLLEDDLIYEMPRGASSFYKNLNFRNYLLDKHGIDLDNVFREYYSTIGRVYGEYFELYYDRVNEHSIPNIYSSNFMLLLINTKLYNQFRLFQFYNNDRIYEILKIENRSIVVQMNSICQRPKALLEPIKAEPGFSLITTLDLTDSWIRIASFECQLHKEQFGDKYKEYLLYGGISFLDNPSEGIPYSGYRLNVDWIWSNPIPEFEIDDSIIFSNIQFQDSYERLKLLWLNPQIVNHLGLFPTDYTGGLSAIDSKGDIILKYNTWQSGYKGEGINSELPTLDGAELVIRADYFEKLKKRFGYDPKYALYRKG